MEDAKKRARCIWCRGSTHVSAALTSSNSRLPPAQRARDALRSPSIQTRSTSEPVAVR